MLGLFFFYRADDCPPYLYIKKKKQSGQIEGQKTKVEHLACKSSPYAWPSFFFIGRMIVHLIKTKTKKTKKKKQSRQNVACYGR